MTQQNQPTVFHVTHWKAGSQWIYGVLQMCAPDRIVKPKVKVAHFYEDPILNGMIYPTVYVPHNRFVEKLSASDYPTKVFVVIRDLRDALTSLYFSLKVSHPLISDNVAEGHRKLNEMKSEEEGLLYVVDERGQASANIQHSWLAACKKGEALLLRYEDMIADEQQAFAKIIEYCQIDIPAKKLTEIVEGNSFTKRAGRKPGEEDVSSHYRKGVSGDWKNHFTDHIKAEFKQKFGQLLIDTGYEKDLNW
ncbi:MAG: sulfotransferase domain-containing protein [Chloroflexota bacterium]